MRRRPCDLTRGERAIRWIEDWCQTPAERPVCLSVSERTLIYRLYDGGLPMAEPVAGPLAAYLALLHLAGVEARNAPPARLEANLFTLWNAACSDLRCYLVRRGETVACPQCGTSWAAAA